VTDERPPAPAGPFSGRTAWARSLETPLRVFLRTETGSAAVLAAMTVAALAWVNISASSYESVWATHLSVRLAGAGVSLELRDWVNSGLMTFFFFIFGLEARREFDMGELRVRSRLALPFLAGLAGMISGPLLAVQVGMGDAMLIVAFLVIVIGGIGSIAGAFVAAIIVGIVDTLGRFLLPQWFGFTAGPALASMANYALMAAVLFARPQGLLGARRG